MAAWSGDDEIGFRGDALKDRIVGCRITGVESDEDINVADIIISDASNDKL